MFSHQETKLIKYLESKKEMLLDNEEKILRLKNRALWLEAGNKNSNFFHNYASHRRNINTICEIKNQEGSLVHTFEEKTALGIGFFQNIFKEL